MKSFLMTVLMILVSTSAYALHINCSGANEDSKVEVFAQFFPGLQLSNITLQYDANLKNANFYPTSFLVRNYNPRTPAYKGMDRFQLSNNGWSQTSLLLPKKLADSADFAAYYYDQGEAGLGTIQMTCKVQ